MQPHHLRKILRQYSFFEELSDQTFELVINCASTGQFPAGKFIFKEGDLAHHFYLIQKGFVSLEVATPQHGFVVIETLGEGDLLGWSWLIPPFKWHFDARALEKTEMISIDGQLLRQNMEKHPAQGYELLKRFIPVIVNRMQATRMRLLDLYAAPAGAGSPLEKK